MGQAAGTAAAYAVRHNLTPIQLQDHPDGVREKQENQALSNRESARGH